MSVATKLQGLITGKQYVIDKLNAKAETSLEINAKWTDIGDTIENISVGIVPTETMDIALNGEYDVTNYGKVIVKVVGGEGHPQLNTPTVSRSGDTFTITNPSTNGNFVDTYKVYNASTMIIEQTGKTISLKSLNAGVYDLSASCSAENFNDSLLSNVIHVEVYSINYEILELSKSTSEIKISDGLTHSSTLTPTNGWWLPELIKLYVNNELQPQSTYSWDMYTGKFSYVAKGDIIIVATADEEPKLKRPPIEFSGLISNQLTISDVKYAMEYDVYVNDVLVNTFEYTDESLLAPSIAIPAIEITSDFVLTIVNDDYESKKSYNVFYEVYGNDDLIINEKEGV